MDQQTSGSVTGALTQGDRADPDLIVGKCGRRYESQLRAEARRKLPRERQRAADVEDVMQESWLALHLKLRTGHTFQKGKDILYWLYRVVRNRATSTFNRNIREVGPSACVDRFLKGDDRSDDKDGSKRLEEQVSEDGCREVPPNEAAHEAEVQVEADELKRTIDGELDLVEDSTSRQIIEMWLNHKTFAEIAEATGVTQWNVKSTTFHFKQRPSLDARTKHLRAEIEAAERAWPRVGKRIDLGRSLRLLLDERESLR